MTLPADWAVKAREQLLRWRWPLVALAGAVFIALEVHEHRPATTILANPEFVREVLLFGIMGPILAGLVLSLVMHTTEERVQAYQRLDLEHGLGQQLASASSWDELTALIVRFPRKVLPLIGASLLVRGQAPDEFDMAGEWWEPDVQCPVSSTRHRSRGPCQAWRSAQVSSSSALFQCRCADSAQAPELRNRYCLPLIHGAVVVGWLYHYLPHGVQPTADQIDCLDGLAPAMAMALDSARPDRAAALQAAATHRERERIARDLHDTLGQSLGYLHLKLDQLVGDDSLREIVEIRRELERMRLVASQSYQQLRRAVAGLHPTTSAELATTLQERAQAVADRAGLQIELVVEGQARPLAPETQYQVLHIVREALSNVEKHARAQRVRVHLSWGEDSLSVVTADDGSGFDLSCCAHKDHFGLGIMRERAEEIGGTLYVTSSPGAGTEVRLVVPGMAPRSGSNGGGA